MLYEALCKVEYAPYDRYEPYPGYDILWELPHQSKRFGLLFAESNNLITKQCLHMVSVEILRI